MTGRRAPRPLGWLGALLVLYLTFPVAAFVVRVATGHDEGWNVAGLWSALGVSAEGATISVLIGAVTGIPLAYVLAHRRGWLSSVIGVIVQLPLAVPPLISGILLIYLVGPYTFLGQLSGERLTQSMYGLVIAQTFVSLPFLVVVARSAFRAVDPSLCDVAATLGYGPLARFVRVDATTASEGLRAGMVLMWLRAFGEYGTTVVLAYHPYSIPVYVDNLFSSAPLSQEEAPTVLAFGIVVLVVALGQLRRPDRGRRREMNAVPVAPPPMPKTSVDFAIRAVVGTFSLEVAHTGSSHRLAVVGPSGSGKSLTLRAIAGLLGPGAGIVRYGDLEVSGIPPEGRRVGYVPQGFGLLPGRTVWQQVVFGLEADPARAVWWLKTLHLDGLWDRLPEELSGGQRQRVALARSLASDPQVVLLDEPFSALDAPVRAELRRELRRLQREVGLSTVLVTHDPEEAAMLADEIVVVRDGRVLQSGSCREVYQRPASVEIGRLLGIDNLFEGVVTSTGVLLSGATQRASGLRGVEVNTPSRLAPGTPVLWQVEPEALLLSAETPTQTRGSTMPVARGRVADTVDLGRSLEVVVELTPGLELRARTSQTVELSVGSSCRLETDLAAVSVWPMPSVVEPRLVGSRTPVSRSGSATPSNP